MDSKESTPYTSASEVARLVAQGKPIVIYDGYALNLDAWIDQHPGGRLAILHMVGRDATIEIDAYHSAKALLMMKKHRLGRIQTPWTNIESPIRSSSYKERIQQAKKQSATAQCHKKRQSISIAAKAILPPKLCTSDTKKPDPDHEMLSPTIFDIDAEKLSSPCEIEDDSEVTTSERTSHAIAFEKKEIADGLREWPALDMETQQSITREYQALHEEIKARGLYKCNYSNYAIESIRYAILFGTFLYFLRKEWYITSAVFLGFFWQQFMFTAHDAGHRGITGDFVYDSLIGAFVADFCCGLSIGWWKSSHNVHHLVTNMPEHDPDIQNIPLFSTSPTFMKNVFSTFYNFEFIWDAAAEFLVPYQKYTYYPVMGIARFNLYLLSWLHLLSPRAKQLGSAQWTRSVEIVFMLCYWAIFGYGLLWCTLPTWPIRVGFVLTSHMITMLLHVQITLSHWGMPTSDLGPAESFPQHQLRTTMDVDCPPWLDFLHGGLQFQAVHHLFPRVPRHNLRECQKLVRVFCEKTQLKYQCYGFVEGNQVVLSRLEEVANMVDMMVKCQLDMAKTGESGLH